MTDAMATHMKPLTPSKNQSGYTEIMSANGHDGSGVSASTRNTSPPAPGPFN